MSPDPSARSSHSSKNYDRNRNRSRSEAGSNRSSTVAVTERTPESSCRPSSTLVGVFLHFAGLRANPGTAATWTGDVRDRFSKAPRPRVDGVGGAECSSGAAPGPVAKVPRKSAPHEGPRSRHANPSLGLASDSRRRDLEPDFAMLPLTREDAGPEERRMPGPPPRRLASKRAEKGGKPRGLLDPSPE